MTLHEAIESILQESGKSMTSREIADIINQRKLYTRKDGLEVSASQVTTRAGNYDKLFTRHLGKIKLLKDDLVSLTFHKYRNKITHSLNTSNRSNPKERIEILIKALEDFQNDAEYNENPDDFIVSEPRASYGIRHVNTNLKIGYRLCNWFLLQDRDSKMVFAEKFIAVLSSLEWFQVGHHTVMTDIQNSNHFILKILADNPDATFKVFNRNKTYSDKGIGSKPLKINEYVERLIKKNYSLSSRESSLSKTGIIIPPFLRTPKERRPIAFESILQEIASTKPRYDKAILVVPAGVLFSTNTKEVEARREILESGYLDSVILFPNGMVENSGIILAVLIFDFKKYNENTFFIDASEILKENPANLVQIINQKTIVKDVSAFIHVNTIKNKELSLYPPKYIFNPNEVKSEPGQIEYTLKDLILAKKSGVRFKNRNSLYQGGEYKLIRTSEIDKNTIYFEPKNSILGIDHDEIINPEKYLIKGGIVLSGFNKSIKAAVLSNKESFVLGQDVYWLKPDSSMVVAEYLVSEFKKPYIKKQIQYYSTGAVISRIFLKDILKIKVQLPPLEVQKDIIFKTFRKLETKHQDINVSNKEVDFIKTLKHSLKQPTSSLGNDLSALRTFLKRKIKDGTSISSEETIVPVFSDDTPEDLKIHELSCTLDRMSRSVSDIDYILQQAMLIITAGNKPDKENIDLKLFLKNLSDENPEITINVIGVQMEILGDRKQLRILFANLIDNAKRHGFLGHWEKPTIWIEVKAKDALSFQISVRNNGKPLPSEFTIENFLAKGGSSNSDVGSGFGGFLIGQILKNHNGQIELPKNPQFGILAHNVEFLITLPK